MLSPKCQTRAPSAACSPSSSSPLPSSTSPACPSPSTWAQPPERWGFWIEVYEWSNRNTQAQLLERWIFNTQLISLVLEKIPLVDKSIWKYRIKLMTGSGHSSHPSTKSIWKYRINLINDRFWTLFAPWSFGWSPSSSTMPSGVSSQFSCHRYEVVVADNAPWLSWTNDTTRWTTNAE